jgi:hypothetical protein
MQIGRELKISLPRSFDDEEDENEEEEDMSLPWSRDQIKEKVAHNFGITKVRDTFTYRWKRFLILIILIPFLTHTQGKKKGHKKTLARIL